MPLRLNLLGRPSVEADGAVFEPPVTKVTALLLHLGYRGDWVGRDELAGLLWPEVPEESARANLRKIVARARALPWADLLEAERARLRWRVPTDVRAFEEALAADDAEGIAHHYRGPLFDGFRVGDAAAFDDWLAGEREHLHDAWRAALMRHAAALESSDPERALPLLRILCDDDPLDEEALQSYLRCAQGRAERGRALRAYERFRALLDEEMALEPLDATRALAERAREDPGPAEAPPPAAPPPAVAVAERAAEAPGLPREITPFVDRPADLRAVAARLDEPDCRLLTLVGPGGVGKTRLALRTAMHRESRYRDGVRAVALADAETRAELVDAVARALGLEPGRDTEARLAARLHGAETLLLLDNLEQLADAAGWLAELLRSAPGLQLLATSRASLELSGEWIYPVRGLPYPEVDPSRGGGEAGDAGDEAGGEAVDLERWPATALFAQAARRHGVTPGPRDAPAIVRICRAVEGMPLALELAASWVRMLSVDEIATELETDNELLSGGERDLPERHRSIDAVFDTSWRLLNPAQRRTLARLAIFRGGFDRPAAGEVTGAGARALLELVSRSLLRRRDDGRFDLHPLVRQCAYRKLAADPDEEAALRERHGAHFLSVLQRCDEMRRSGRLREALATFDGDYANLRAMWQWAVERREVDALERCAGAVEQYYVLRSRYPEGIELFADAAERLDAHDPAQHAAIGRLLTSRGWFHTRMGDYDAGRRCAARARALLEPLGPRVALCECINLQGSIAGMSGAYDDARVAFERAFAMATELGDERHATYYLNNLAITERNLGNLAEAEALYRRALAAGRRFGELVTVVRNLNNLGLLLRARGDLDGADACLHEGLELAREMGFEQPLAHLTSSLGATAFERGRLEEAQAWFERALQRVRTSGSRGLEAETLTGLAMVAVARADAEAPALLRRALELAHAIGSERQCLGVAVEVAWLWADSSDPGAVTELLERVLRHPASGAGSRQRAARLAERIGIEITTGDDGESDGEGGSEPLNEWVERLLRQLEP